MHHHLFSLLRYSLGGELDSCLTDGSINWYVVYQEAKRQAVASLTYVGVEKLCRLDNHEPGQWFITRARNASKKEKGNTTDRVTVLPSDEPFVKPPLKLLLEWIGEARHTAKQNRQMDEKCAYLCELFTTHGFRNCIIKGQGVAMLYGGAEVHLEGFRKSGDIDIWVEGSRKDIIQFVHSQISGKRVDICKKHIEMPIFENTIVEVHFTPSTLTSPIANRRLQQFFKENAPECYSNKITTNNGNTFNSATVYLDSIQILTHIFGHFLYEGVGLRQIIDYYFVLQQLDTKDRARAHAILKSIGLEKFTSAVMYILHETLGLQEEYLIAPQDESYGKMLLEEIMEGGNFGKSSALVRNKKHASALWRFFQHTKREWRFFSLVPREIIWSPYRRIATYFWRLSKGYIKIM